MGSFASQDFDVSARFVWKCCGDLRRPTFSVVKSQTSIADIYGDDESAQKLHRIMSGSWLVKFP